MATLYGLVDLMVRLKMNQLHLYMEHTFAYTDHKYVCLYVDPIPLFDHLDRRVAARLVFLGRPLFSVHAFHSSLT